MSGGLKRLNPIMFVGTGSDVGKSVVNTAFCRIFLKDGYSPAPFKAQNMSLNSFPTPNGLEIGRAQAVQAEACGIECRVEMNPVLLKPTSNQSAQVVLNGKPIGNQSAKEYFIKYDREPLFQEAVKGFRTLEKLYNPIVLEGAGSISEVNLREKDITNMRMALEVQADVYLVADIDKGGVFGAVYGTLELLPDEERKLVKGIVINKFRGDIEIFREGIQRLEELAGVPVVSVIPYFRDIYIDDEDSVVLSQKKRARSVEERVNVVVVLLPHMSNFTDFNILERIEEVNMYYSHDAEEILSADIVILPGSKNTIEDLQHLRKEGLAKAILKAHEKGAGVYGVCGGFQMMGREIYDPYNVESKATFIPGLGILPVKTTLTKEKTTRQRTFSFLEKNESCEGYEIHMGETEVVKGEESRPLCFIDDGREDGYFLNDKTWGSYIHGIFDNPQVVSQLLDAVGTKKINRFDSVAFKEEQYNKLADLVRAHTKMDVIYQNLMNQ